MEDGKGKVELDVRQDGVYLLIDNTEVAQRVGRKDVLALLEGCGVKDIDFNAVNEAFRQGDRAEVKISANTNIIQQNEVVTIEISKDKMEAYVSFTPPGYKGKKLDKEDIQSELMGKGVMYGVMEDKIAEIAQSREYGEKYLVAVGEEPVNGVDGYLEYLFDTEGGQSNKPKILEDGNVDFRQISYFQGVDAHQLLVRVIPAVSGQDGINVLRQTISHKRGKPAPKFLKGKHVYANSDETELYAEISGQLTFVDRRVSVSPLLEISDDVGTATGNINFMGSVYIKGNVTAGFTVKATGNIEIHGVVEGAILEAGADVSIFGGVQGSNKAVITAGGNIVTKFAQNVSMVAQGNVEADYIMHCHIKCDGSLKLSGKKCLLVGGVAMVGKKISAKVIGSPMATSTEIKVGNKPGNLESYNKIKEAYNATKVEYEKVSHMAESLMKNEISKNLSLDKKDILLKAMHTKSHLREKMESQQAALEEAVNRLGSDAGLITADDVLYAGVKVLIGNALLFVKDPIFSCSLRNVDGKIVIGAAK